MHSRKQLAQVIDQLIIESEIDEDIEPSIVDEYKRLDKKCDVVIDKIKTRKGKKTTEQTED
jgi:hypothetical protein